MSNDHCEAHDEYLISVATLTANVKSLNSSVDNMQGLFKWTIGIFVTVCLFILGATATFTYKASDLYSQVQVNTVEIKNHKERLDVHGILKRPIQQ